MKRRNRSLCNRVNVCASLLRVVPDGYRHGARLGFGPPRADYCAVKCGLFTRPSNVLLWFVDRYLLSLIQQVSNLNVDVTLGQGLEHFMDEPSNSLFT